MRWDELRARFPVTRRWAFFDHAAIAPLSAPAVAALREYGDNLAENGIAAVGRWTRRIKEVRGLNPATTWSSPRKSTRRTSTPG